MEKLIERIEKFIEQQIENFEASPVKTSIKILIVLFILKAVYKEIKE